MNDRPPSRTHNNSKISNEQRANGIYKSYPPWLCYSSGSRSSSGSSGGGGASAIMKGYIKGSTI